MGKRVKMSTYNFNHLYHFYVIAKLGGLTVAARHLNTSQSSLSVQIRTLESTLGCVLFEKSGRKIILTEMGREIFAYSRRAFEVFDSMRERLESPERATAWRVSFGVTDEIERPFVADLVGKVLRTYPVDQKPIMNLVSLPREALMQMLRLGEIDFLLAGQIDVRQDVELLAQGDLAVYAYRSKRAAKIEEGATRLEEVLKSNKTRFVAPSKGVVLRVEMDGFLQKRKIAPFVVYESNVLSAVVRAATDGLGIALLPGPYVSREVLSRELQKLSEKPLWKHRVMLACLRDGLDERRRVFAKLMKAELKAAVSV